MKLQYKFKVWDTRLKQFINWNSYIPFDSNEYEIYQFTNACDSFGNEIYDGDLLIYESPSKELLLSKSLSPEIRLECHTNIVQVRFSEPREDNHPGWRICDSYGQYGKCKVIGHYKTHENITHEELNNQHYKFE